MKNVSTQSFLPLAIGAVQAADYGFSHPIAGPFADEAVRSRNRRWPRPARRAGIAKPVKLRA